jgi:N-acetylneuraminic acid mutarotase
VYGNTLSDLHAFDPVAVAWKDLSAPVDGTAPTARSEHGFTSADGKLYVHGGCATDACPANDLHVFDPVTKVWTDLSDGATSPPTARRRHGFASAGKRLYVHAGYGYAGAVG